MRPKKKKIPWKTVLAEGLVLGQAKSLPRAEAVRDEMCSWRNSGQPGG